LKTGRSIKAGSQESEILLQRNQLIEMSAKPKRYRGEAEFFTNVSMNFDAAHTYVVALQDMLDDKKVMSLAGRNIIMVNQNAYRLLKLVTS